MKIKPAIGSVSTKIFFILLLLISLIVCNKQSESRQGQGELKIQPKGWDSSFVKNSEANELLKKKYYPRYNILQTGNYALLDKDESETFCLNDNDWSRDPSYKRDKLHKLVVYNKKAKAFVECDFYPQEINNLLEINDLDFLLKKKLFGPCNGYLFVYDLNGNGVNEIITFERGEGWLDPVIYEFIDGKFVKTLEGTEINLYNIHVLDKGKIIVIGIWYDGDEDNQKKMHDWLIFNWDPDKKKYLAIDKGEWKENELPAIYRIDKKR